jgi:hypothetical protein
LTEAATVEASPAFRVEALRAAVQKAGYAVAERSMQLDIEGMTWRLLRPRVEKALKKVPDGVTAMAELAAIVRNTCRTPHAGPEAPSFEISTTPSPKQSGKHWI